MTQDAATLEAPASLDALHRGAVVIDGRDPTYLVYRQMPAEKAQYWDALQSGGTTAVLVDVPWIDDGFAEMASNLAAWLDRITAASERALLVRSADDILEAKESKRVGVVLTSQTPTVLEKDPRLVRASHAMGLRVMQMSYQRRNFLADGCGESSDGGVSDFGREMIHEMNRVGIAIDLSHASDRTMYETIRESTVPVFFSHSNARSKAAHRRNVPDEHLRLLAERGGVCGVSAYSDFLAIDGSATGTSLDDFAQMVRYVINLIGVEHVGFGLDAGEARTPEEMVLIGRTIGGGTDISKRYAIQSRSQLPEFTHALGRAGLTEDEIEKVLGKNLLRFFTDVWRE